MSNITDELGNHNEYTMALVDVEIHNSGPWNYGMVKFSNLIIESETISTEWCTRFVFLPCLHTTTSLSYTCYCFWHDVDVGVGEERGLI